MSVTIAAVATGVTISSLLATIKDAVTIMKDLPGAASALSTITKSILNLAGRKGDQLDESSPYGQTIKNEEENIKKLIKEFNDLLLRDDIDDYTKELHRKRIAVKICKLLTLLQNFLKDFIQDYSSLKDFFCLVAQKA